MEELLSDDELIIIDEVGADSPAKATNHVGFTTAAQPLTYCNPDLRKCHRMKEMRIVLEKVDIRMCGGSVQTSRYIAHRSYKRAMKNYRRATKRREEKRKSHKSAAASKKSIVDGLHSDFKIPKKSNRSCSLSLTSIGTTSQVLKLANKHKNNVLSLSTNHEETCHQAGKDSPMLNGCTVTPTENQRRQKNNLSTVSHLPLSHSNDGEKAHTQTENQRRQKSNLSTVSHLPLSHSNDGEKAHTQTENQRRQKSNLSTVSHLPLSHSNDGDKARTQTREKVYPPPIFVDPPGYIIQKRPKEHKRQSCNEMSHPLINKSSFVIGNKRKAKTSSHLRQCNDVKKMACSSDFIKTVSTKSFCTHNTMKRPGSPLKCEKVKKRPRNVSVSANSTCVEHCDKRAKDKHSINTVSKPSTVSDELEPKSKVSVRSSNTPESESQGKHKMVATKLNTCRSLALHGKESEVPNLSEIEKVSPEKAAVLGSSFKKDMLSTVESIVTPSVVENGHDYDKVKVRI